MVTAILRGTPLYLACLLGATGCTVHNEVQTPTAIERQVDCIYKLVVEDSTGSRQIGTAVAVLNQDEGDHHFVYMLTAKHVLELADGKTPGPVYIIGMYNSNMGVYTTGTLNPLPVRSFDLHPTMDVAVIKAEALSPLPIAQVDFSRPTRFQRVYGISIPASLAPYCTEGFISYYDEEQKVYTTNCFALPGSSGGGIFDLKTGTLLGITVKVAMLSPGMELRIPIPEMQLFISLSEILDWLQEKGIHEPTKQKAA